MPVRCARPALSPCRYRPDAPVLPAPGPGAGRGCSPGHRRDDPRCPSPGAQEPPQAPHASLSCLSPAAVASSAAAALSSAAAVLSGAGASLAEASLAEGTSAEASLAEATSAEASLAGA